MLISTIQIGVLLFQITPGQSGRIQDGTPDAPISGVVLNAATGQPLERASVAVLDQQEKILHHAVTGPDGRFSFPKVSVGNRLRVWRRGYQDESHGDVWEKYLSSSGEREFKVTLVELGAIAGRVTGENGEPLLGITVEALASSVWEGRRHVSPFASGRTDDLGQYRLWHLHPGRYYVKALGRRYSIFGLGQIPITRDSELAYGPQYFPSGASQEEATLLTVQSGETLQADFRLSGHPAYAIRGRLVRYTPHEEVQIELMRGAEVVGSRVKVDLATGAFEAADVPAGSYTLIARTQASPRKRGEAQVTVGSSHVTGVTLSLSGGVTLKGTIRGSEAGRVSYGVVQLEVMDAASLLEEYSASEGKVDANGEFQIPNVLPGRYGVKMAGRLDMAEIRSGSVDVLREGLTVTEAGCPPLELTVSSGSGRLEIEITGSPEAKAAWVAVVRTVGELVYSQSQPKPTEGPLVFFNLAPGEYRVLAWSQNSPVEYKNKTVLDSLGGRIAKVVVRDGETAKVSVALPPESKGGVAQ